MSESQQHADSVNLIKKYIFSNNNFADFKKGLIPQKEVSVTSFPIVNSTSRADIEFSHYLDEIYIIGEAKTVSDNIEKNIVQLENYIKYLKLKNNPWLIYAVPYIDIQITKNSIIKTIDNLDAQKIRFEVLEYLY